MGTQDEFIRLGAQANQRRANSKNDQNNVIPGIYNFNTH